MPEPDDEVEQHLTINNEGWVWFSGYNFGCGSEQYEKARSKDFKIDKAAADKLLDAIAAYFGNEYVEIFAADIGEWVIDVWEKQGYLVTTEGNVVHYGPGYVVLAAVESGELDGRRLESYHRFKHETSYDGLSSKEIEVTKRERMLKKAGGMKNARRFAKNSGNGNKEESYEY